MDKALVTQVWGPDPMQSCNPSAGCYAVGAETEALQSSQTSRPTGPFQIRCKASAETQACLLTSTQIKKNRFK